MDTLTNALLQANLSGAPGSFVSVKILLDSNIVHHTVPDVIRFFAKGGAAANRLTVRGVNEFPEILHAKMVLIDGTEAYLIGSPFENEYWDGTLHRTAEPRRPRGRGLNGRPVHDVSLRITGKALDDLEEAFIELWNHRDNKDFGGRDHLLPHRVFATTSGGQSAQIVRTVPVRFLPGLASGERGVLESYERAIAEARSFIYIENQYFTARPIVEALQRALRSNPALEAILVINENPDLPNYKKVQDTWLGVLNFAQHPRLGVFALWSASPLGTTPGAAEINQVYVHSKVAIVDDGWAALGSANLDGASQYATEYFNDQNTFNFEINAVLFDGVADQPPTGNVALIRRQLWAEHLGIPPARLVAPPPGGWLRLWRDVATANVALLNSTTPPSMSGRILPYSRRTDAKSQLNDVSVNVSPTRLRILV